MKPNEISFAYCHQKSTKRQFLEFFILRGGVGWEAKNSSFVSFWFLGVGWGRMDVKFFVGLRPKVSWFEKVNQKAKLKSSLLKILEAKQIPSTTPSTTLFFIFILKNSLNFKTFEYCSIINQKSHLHNAVKIYKNSFFWVFLFIGVGWGGKAKQQFL